MMHFLKAQDKMYLGFVSYYQKRCGIINIYRPIPRPSPLENILPYVLGLGFYFETIHLLWLHMA